MVFVISAIVYMVCALFYVAFGSGERQPWDNPEKDDKEKNKKKEQKKLEAHHLHQVVSESQH